MAVELNTQDEFEDFVRSDELSVVHFYAPWAAQCSQIDDVMKEMGKLDEYKNVRFAKIEAENVPEVSLKIDIAVVPTIILLRNSGVVDRVDGVKLPALKEKIEHHLNNKDASMLIAAKSLKSRKESFEDKKESLEDRMRKLINQAPCMLFMKGNPNNPRCGFSRTIVSILNDYKADYGHFDILEDHEIREGLKKFSNWPTYPQLYLHGELIGGLDIIKEMKESNELENMLPKKHNVEVKS